MLQMNNTTKIALIAFFGNLYLYNHVGTLYLQLRGLSLLQVSSITSIIIGTVFVAEVPTGVLADKIGRKWSVVIALFLQALGEYLYFFAGTYSVFVLIAILAGIGYAFLSGASEALVYDSLPSEGRERRMKKAMGLVGSANHLAFFVAPLLGGFVVSELVLSEYRQVILYTAFSVTIALLVSLSLKEPETEYEHTEEGPIQILKAGIREISLNPQLKHILLITTLTASFSGLLINLYQPYFSAEDVPVLWIGLSLSFAGLLSAFVQRYAYKIEEVVGRKWALLILTLWPSFMYFLFASVAGTYVLVVVFMLAYASTDARKPLLSSYQNQLIGSKNRATILSLFNMVTSVYIAVVGLALGRVADYSLPLSFTVIGVLILFFAATLRVDRIRLSVEG